jgi:hypothetical protein
LAATLKPQHRIFADCICKGMTGVAAAQEAGFPGSDHASSSTRILRRDDVKRYIRLVQQHAAIATVVTTEAILNYLWLTVHDPATPVKYRATCLAHLVRMNTATYHPPGDAKAVPREAGGLSDDLVTQLEAQLLGIRAPVGPEA